MKVNRIKFSQIKTQWEILKIASAIAKHDQDTYPVDYDNYEFDVEYTPEEFHKAHQPLSSKSKYKKQLLIQLKVLEEIGQDIINEERYEEMREWQETYNNLKRKINNFNKHTNQ